MSRKSGYRFSDKDMRKKLGANILLGPRGEQRQIPELLGQFGIGRQQASAVAAPKTPC
jgi:hypothetical protein